MTGSAESLRLMANRLRKPSSSTWALAASGWITLGLTHLPAANPVRATTVFVFFLVCPGLALSSWVRVRGVERWTLAIALSISVGLLLSTAMTLLRDGSFGLHIGILAAVTTVAALGCPSPAAATAVAPPGKAGT